MDAVRNAAVLAGWNIMMVVPEEVAAFCASNLQLSAKKEIALVVDYGAKSLNLSIVECHNDEVRLLASKMEPSGSEDLDEQTLVEPMQEIVKAENADVDWDNEQPGLVRLRKECKRA